MQYFGESLDGGNADTQIRLSALLSQAPGESLHPLLWDLSFQKQCTLLVKASSRNFSDYKLFLSCSYYLRLDLNFEILV